MENFDNKIPFLDKYAFQLDSSFSKEADPPGGRPRPPWWTDKHV